MLLFLVFLAVYRITRLLVADQFPPVAAVRDRVADRYGPDSWQAYLSNCPWCVSVYVAALLVLVVHLATDGALPYPLLVWPAASAVCGLITANLDPE